MISARGGPDGAFIFDDAPRGTPVAVVDMVTDKWACRFDRYTLARALLGWGLEWRWQMDMPAMLAYTGHRGCRPGRVFEGACGYCGVHLDPDTPRGGPLEGWGYCA